MSILFKKVLISVACLLALLFVLGACGSNREYYDDIHLALGADREVIIKEWSFLLGSGAEIYYNDGNKTVFLGNLLGGDDGFCPFKEGLYSVNVNGNELTIEWCRSPSESRDSWDKKTFELSVD